MGQNGNVNSALTLFQLLKVLGVNAWGVGNVPWNVTSQMVKDEDLQKMIRSTRSTYAQGLKMAWDVKNWDQESIKVSSTQELTFVLDFYELKWFMEGKQK